MGSRGGCLKKARHRE